MHIDPAQAQFNACNSSLSEFAVLGFELGYSLENPASLVMWEAQFGDFANTAQCMIDQFISSGEQKWLRQSGLTMLLPHGYEGQGPEHSSARLERFLQMCDDDEDVFPAQCQLGKQSRIQSANWQIVNVTTPAQYFHVLRRQVWRDFRKPLVVMSPKSLLRHRLVKSDIDDFVPGTRFQRLLPDTTADLVAPESVRKLVLCSGKVYYDLLAARDKDGVKDVAIARVEQISPFPSDHVQAQVAKYPNAQVVWCQEEPKNAGSWTYVRPRIVTAARDVREVTPLYAGRKPAASTATGYGSWHVREVDAFISEALG
jgi:2-oxoglutarate dehydrogenase E1 component